MSWFGPLAQDLYVKPRRPRPRCTMSGRCHCRGGTGCRTCRWHQLFCTRIAGRVGMVGCFCHTSGSPCGTLFACWLLVTGQFCKLSKLPVPGGFAQNVHLPSHRLQELFMARSGEGWSMPFRRPRSKVAAYITTNCRIPCVLASSTPGFHNTSI